MTGAWFGRIMALAATLPVGVATAAEQTNSPQWTFRLGSGGAVLCSAQNQTADKALRDMFDQAYSVVCRDAATSIGHLYVLRLRGGDPAARLAALRAEKAVCQAPEQGQIEGLGAVEVANCTLKAGDLAYRVYTWRQGNSLYAAEGFTGYDSALRLGLRTIVAGKPVDGAISIATTEAGDAASLARAQARGLDPQSARAEAYRRSNRGSYAEAAEFFGALIAGEQEGTSHAEALVNQAVQQSNLGNIAEATMLFTSAQALIGGDPVTARMLRNYRAIHLMNQQRPRDALAELDKPLPLDNESAPAVRDLVIDSAMARRLNSESAASRRLSVASPKLTPAERAQILDAQAQHVRGAILRVEERNDEAVAALRDALAQLIEVRGGRVTSIVWMRAQIHGDLGAIAEARNDLAEAEGQHKGAVALLVTDYPASSALMSAEARLAGFYARNGRGEEARALFRKIVDANAETGNSSAALRRTLAPYFAMLSREADQPAAVAEMFRASQILVRPGVAQTQAVLARELSGGSDEAARLFRQSVTLTRDLERTRVEIARLAVTDATGGEGASRLAALRDQLEQLENSQVATQVKLAEFPRYRVLSGGALTLPDLQQVLREGEGYYKMIMVGDEGYAMFVTPRSAAAFQLGVGPAELDRQVDALRATISVQEDGEIVTRPFDVERAYALYEQLFRPVSGDIVAVRHLIFEPDGAMLRLPPNLLVTDHAGVDAYFAKARRPDNDGFDFTDLKWLGRDRDISTAVSVRSFRDVRQVAPSKASRNYIGFGQNAPPEPQFASARAMSALLGETSSCYWRSADWYKPISADELYAASRTMERSGQRGVEIVTGAVFTDTAISAREDLSQYRIMHFATHGLLKAPRAECPARPALMTSFGGKGSDGLLSFSEIYDLNIDADLVILSACDTAGKASFAATREAGVTTGGDFALDGLVRAFVGAGGRSIIASHWPVPDDYDATKRLIAGLFTAPRGSSTATALRSAEAVLMAAPETSHPYYWAGFAIIGDGAAVVLPQG